MSDFDAVLERLLGDPSFKAQLAADPAGVLAGYRLAPDEVELLRSQVTGDTGGQQHVEQRTSKASLFGLLPGLGSSIGDAASGAVSPAAHGLGGPVQGVDSAPSQGLSAATGAGGQFTEAVRGGGDSTATPPSSGVAASAVGTASGPTLGRNLGHLPGAGESSGFGASDAPVEHYRTRVDADGDGRWDAHTYAHRPDGGVDIVVDANRDGRTDFIGHDLNRDGTIDRATVDSDGDGRLDTHWVDDNGDGWLDRRIPVDPTEPGQAPVGRHRGPDEALGEAR